MSSRYCRSNHHSFKRSNIFHIDVAEQHEARFHSTLTLGNLLRPLSIRNFIIICSKPFHEKSQKQIISWDHFMRKAKSKTVPKCTKGSWCTSSVLTASFNQSLWSHHEIYGTNDRKKKNTYCRFRRRNHRLTCMLHILDMFMRICMHATIMIMFVIIRMPMSITMWMSMSLINLRI